VSGLKRVPGIDATHPKAIKVKTAKAPKMPNVIRESIPKMPRITPSHGIAGSTHASHGAQVVRAMQPRLVSRPARIPGVPTGNPAPDAALPKGTGVPTVYET
jgi:hypothetical protein